MMTKKHFELIASTLRHLAPPRELPSSPRAYEQWRATVESFADMCAASNPRFNRTRFLAACGVEG